MNATRYDTLNRPWVKSRTLRDAMVAICRDCEWQADHCHPYWGLSKRKWMHENGSGTGHKVDYWRLAS